MNNTNFFAGIVKILEIPKQYVIDEKISVTKIHAELSQNRKNQIILLSFWGSLGNKIKDIYKENDYILVEGYLSFQKQKSLISDKKTSKIVNLTVRKVYPILLNSSIS